LTASESQSLNVTTENRDGEEDPARRLETAYHEAGHAVAALDLGIGFTEVSVVATAEHLGQLVLKETLQRSHVSYITPARLDFLERHMVVGLAGAEGARLLSGDYDHDGAEQDHRNVFTLIHHILVARDGAITSDSRDRRKRDARRYFDDLQSRARELIQARRLRVIALASTLMNQQTIQERDAVRMMLAADE
jgi:hypothetical protein